MFKDERKVHRVLIDFARLKIELFCVEVSVMFTKIAPKYDKLLTTTRREKYQSALTSKYSYSTLQTYLLLLIDFIIIVNKNC